VEGTDLVELDVGRVDPVDLTLGRGEGVEDPLRGGPHGAGEVGGGQQLGDHPGRAVRVVVVVVVAVVVRGLGDDVGPRGRDAAALDPFERHRPAVDPEPAEGGTHGLDIGAGIDQRAEEHVAGDAGRRVDVGDAGHGNILAAAQAAPYPL